MKAFTCVYKQHFKNVSYFKNITQLSGEAIFFLLQTQMKY